MSVVASPLSTTTSLGMASLRYRLTIAAVVREETERWRMRAASIENATLRELALEKLRGEEFNAVAAAMLATLCPRPERSDAARAIVALEILFDYLDGRTEMPVPGNALRGRREQFEPLLAALEQPGGEPPRTRDGDPYAWALSSAAARSLARLDLDPARREAMRRACLRAVEAQVRVHSSTQLDAGELQRWASAARESCGLGWREYLAGSAASILCVHAMLATRTHEDAVASVDEAYLYLAALAAVLDGVVDWSLEDPTTTPQSWLLHVGELHDALASLVAGAAARTRALSRGGAHLGILAGVLAYYATSPGSQDVHAQPIISRLREEHAALLRPAWPLLALWRAKRSIGAGR